MKAMISNNIVQIEIVQKGQLVIRQTLKALHANYTLTKLLILQ